MIYYHNEDIVFRKKNRLKFRSIIKQMMINEKKDLENLNYIFCSDEDLLELNKSALNHDYYTDIITFDYCTETTICGDLFISVERVRDNAQKMNIDFFDEIHRVMLHGVLHLCGYGDKTEKEIKKMRSKEDFYLEKLNQITK